MGARRAAAGLAAAFFLIGVAGVAHGAAPSEAVQRAGKFLVDRQTPAGAWGSSPTIEDVADGVVALATAEVAGGPVNKAIDYLAVNSPADANRPHEVARVVLAAVAAGRDPRNFGRTDYVGRLKTYYNPNNGNFDSPTDPNSYAILAMLAAAEQLPEKALTSLQGRQCGDGGFPRTTCVFGSHIAPTALALNAMAAAGVGSSDPVYAAARSYLLRAQNAEGGFGDDPGAATAAMPTSRVLSALIAMREEPSALPWRKTGNVDPFSALGALQDPSGGFRADRATAAPDELTTIRAVPGYAGLALPVLPAVKEPAPAAVSTTVPAPGAPAGPTTTVGVTRRTLPTRIAPVGQPVVPTTPTTSASEVGLASPARRNASDNGRSLLAVLPFVATLFGAGAVGIVLRRRART